MLEYCTHNTSPMISRFSAAHLSSCQTTSPWSATTHRRSPFHFSGFIVACNPFAVQISRGPFMDSIIPIDADCELLPPFDGRPSSLDLQKAIVVELSKSVDSLCICFCVHLLIVDLKTDSQ